MVWVSGLGLEIFQSEGGLGFAVVGHLRTPTMVLVITYLWDAKEGGSRICSETLALNLYALSLNPMSMYINAHNRHLFTYVHIYIYIDTYAHNIHVDRIIPLKGPCALFVVQKPAPCCQTWEARSDRLQSHEMAMVWRLTLPGQG